MSKTYSLTELTIMAGNVLKAHPEVNKVLVTTDGNVFFESGKNAAELHSRTNGNLTIHEIVRQGSEDTQDEPKKEDTKTPPVDINAVPTVKNTVAEIQAYMCAQEVEFDVKDTKQMLIDKITAHLQEVTDKTNTATNTSVVQ